MIRRHGNVWAEPISLKMEVLGIEGCTFPGECRGVCWDLSYSSRVLIHNAFEHYLHIELTLSVPHPKPSRDTVLTLPSLTVTSTMFVDWLSTLKALSHTYAAWKGVLNHATPSPRITERYQDVTAQHNHPVNPSTWLLTFSTGFPIFSSLNWSTPTMGSLEYLVLLGTELHWLESTNTGEPGSPDWSCWGSFVILSWQACISPRILWCRRQATKQTDDDHPGTQCHETKQDTNHQHLPPAQDDDHTKHCDWESSLVCSTNIFGQPWFSAHEASYVHTRNVQGRLPYVKISYPIRHVVRQDVNLINSRDAEGAQATEGLISSVTFLAGDCQPFSPLELFSCNAPPSPYQSPSSQNRATPFSTFRHGRKDFVKLR